MEDISYTVPEVAELLKTSQGYVYRLIDTGLLPVLKLGRFKIRRSTLLKFLEQYEGYDLSNPDKISKMSEFEEDVA